MKAINPEAPVVIRHDLRTKNGDLACLTTMDDAREWLKANQDYVPVRRAYHCDGAFHQINVVERFGAFAGAEIQL